MPLRRTARSRIALAIAVLALSVIVSACTFPKYATDRIYTPGVGTNNRDGQVDVLAGVVVSAQPGSGTFIASLSNNSTEEAASLTQITSTEGGSLSFSDFEPIEVAPGGFVNLASESGAIEVTGDFQAGDFVELVLSFDNGERVPLTVPVEEEELEYAGLDVTGEPPADDPAGEADPDDVESSESH